MFCKHFDSLQIMTINYAFKRCNCMYGFFKIIQIHAFTPFKLRGKPHSKNKKSIPHKNMVVNLQPQCDFCKDTMHHHKKRGLPRRFTTYFDSFCSNPENDTGLPVIYVVLWECNWFLWNNIPGLSPLKLIIFVKWLVLNVILTNLKPQRIQFKHSV